MLPSHWSHQYQPLTTTDHTTVMLRPKSHTKEWLTMDFSLNSNLNSPQPSIPKPTESMMPLLPRLLPSRTSKKPSLLESWRDSMMDNHSLKLPERWKPSKECSHKSMIWKEDSVSCNLLSQFLKMPLKLYKKLLMSEEWEESEVD